jgi:hypothetical protein
MLVGMSDEGARRAVRIFKRGGAGFEGALILFGLVFLGTSIGVGVSLVPRIQTTLDAVMTYGLTASLFLGGAAMLFLRSRCVVDPASRRVERRTTFAGVLVWRESRSFAEISTVRFDIVTGGRSAPAPRLLLIPRDGSAPLLVSVYVSLDEFPPEALADARELSSLLGVPLEEPINRAD